MPKILLKRGDNPEKGVDIEIEGLPLFYYFTVKLHLLCVCVCVCVWGGGGGVKNLFFF